MDAAISKDGNVRSEFSARRKCLSYNVESGSNTPFACPSQELFVQQSDAYVVRQMDSQKYVTENYTSLVLTLFSLGLRYPFWILWKGRFFSYFTGLVSFVTMRYSRWQYDLNFILPKTVWGRP